MELWLDKMLQVGLNIKEIRSKKGLLQKEVAAAAGLHPANYNKMEKGEREPSIEALDKIAKLFDMTVDQILHYEGNLPADVTIQDKSVAERMKLIDQLEEEDIGLFYLLLLLIDQLEEEDKKALFRIIDGMLTKSKFKDFFQKNVATL